MRICVCHTRENGVFIRQALEAVEIAARRHPIGLVIAVAAGEQIISFRVCRITVEFATVIGEVMLGVVLADAVQAGGEVIKPRRRADKLVREQI